MENFTIHIFGYGETQINSEDLSVKVATSSLNAVTPLVQAIFDKKPIDNESTIDGYHAINIFGYNDVRWMSKEENIEGFNVKDDADLKPLIDDLIAELQAIKDATETATV
jgi:Ca2+-binding EF-hand superfamily protein